MNNIGISIQTDVQCGKKKVFRLIKLFSFTKNLLVTKWTCLIYGEICLNLHILEWNKIDQIFLVNLRNTQFVN